jgi:hypothetical protein
MNKCSICGKDESDEGTIVVVFNELNPVTGCCLFCAVSTLAAVVDTLPAMRAEMRRLRDRVNLAEGGVSPVQPSTAVTPEQPNIFSYGEVEPTPNATFEVPNT